MLHRIFYVTCGVFVAGLVICFTDSPVALSPWTIPFCMVAAAFCFGAGLYVEKDQRDDLD